MGPREVLVVMVQARALLGPFVTLDSTGDVWIGTVAGAETTSSLKSCRRCFKSSSRFLALARHPPKVCRTGVPKKRRN